jgi:GTP-binding protein
VSADEVLPVVVVVGRPNVGKSSLVNRFLGRRHAIVEERPGVTRDRHSAVAEWAGRRFEIVDTGGLEPGQRGLDAGVRHQAEVAIAAADLVLLVVDASVGIVADDTLLARSLLRGRVPAIVVANKVDDGAAEPAAWEFGRLGLGDPSAVSALHGRGSGDLLDRVLAALPSRDDGDAAAPWASAAIVGRPNVGKSSLLNALLGEARALVDADPGTTRDPVDSWLPLDDHRTLRIVDTAGLRRRTRVQDPVEYFSWLRSRRTLERADIALLVVDAATGLTGPDQRIAEAIVSEGRACVVCLNKWDAVGGDERDRARLERDLDHGLRFLPWARRLRTSARTGRGLDRVVPALEEAVASHRRRLPTHLVNQMMHEAQDRRPHPRVRGRPARILFAAQPSISPPTFVVFATTALETSYTRYLERAIRERDPFAGSPVVVTVRRRARDEVER